MLFFFVSRTAAAAALVPYAVSAVLPAKALPWLLNTRFFRCALKYHDFDEVSRERGFERFVGNACGIQAPVDFARPARASHRTLGPRALVKPGGPPVRLHQPSKVQRMG